MFLPFFENLRNGGVPVSLREYLTFLEALGRGLVTYETERFYFLARTAMVKDERYLTGSTERSAKRSKGWKMFPPKH